MNPLTRAQVPLGSSGRIEIARAHDAALAIGGTFCNSRRENEQLCTTQDLLCAAGNAVVEQVMLAQLFHAQTLLDEEFVSAEAHEQARALRDASAGVARMTARALEVHARDTGYSQAVWLTDALDETERLMTDDRDPLFDPTESTVIAMARSVAHELFSALAAAPADRMGVPGHVSRALGASVALFMVADFTYNDDYRLRIS